MPEHNTPMPVPGQDQVTYREVPDFPGYRVGDDGSVWTSLNTQGRFTGVWRPKVGGITRCGYRRVHLYRAGQASSRFVHRLVLTAFVGPCPVGMEAAHQNGNRLDNRLCNLAWKSHPENQADMVGHGTSACGSKNHGAKLTENAVREVVNGLRAGESRRTLAVRFGVCQRTIALIARGERWRHVTQAAVAPGKKHPRKLTAHDAQVIRARIDTGAGVADLAEEYGVCKGTVQNVRARRTWRRG